MVSAPTGVMRARRNDLFTHAVGLAARTFARGCPPTWPQYIATDQAMLHCATMGCATLGTIRTSPHYHHV